MKEAVAPDRAREERPLGWPRARGRHYLDVLEHLHREQVPDWYLEIGCGRGHSMMRSHCRAIGVDPDFRLSGDVMGDRPELHLFRQTSAEFFASGVLQNLAPAIDIAFIDGMHLFDFVLDDFIATEKVCKPGGMILLHDLVPFSPAAAEREWDAARTRGWSGDVWKMVPILREFRPDLDVQVVNPRPCGLGMITGLDPENRVLQEARDEIIARFTDQTIEGFGVSKLVDLLQMQDVTAVFPALSEIETGQ